MQSDALRSIDIIPIIEGADSKTMGSLLIVLGVIVMIIGFAYFPLLAAGLILIMGGVSMLLTEQPKYEPMRNIKQEGAGRSYFFGGAVNIVSEGGPVPVGYGEAVVGSQVISAGFGVGVRTDALPLVSSLPARFYPLT